MINSPALTRWQEAMKNASTQVPLIQNQFQQNKCKCFLDKLSMKANELPLPADNDTIGQQAFDVLWQFIDKKLTKRIKSIQENVLDGPNKTRLLELFRALKNVSQSIIAPALPPAPLSSVIPDKTQRGINLCLHDWLQFHLPEIKKILGTFSPTVFISYAWGDKEEVFVQQYLAPELRDAGIQVRLDIWHNPVTTSIHNGFITELDTVDYAVVVGSPLYAQKCADEKNNVVIAEARIIAERQKRQPKRILPILFTGEPLTSFPPFLRDKVFVYFADSTQYLTSFIQLFTAFIKYAHEEQRAALTPLLQKLRDGEQQIRHWSHERLFARVELEAKRQREQQAALDTELLAATGLATMPAVNPNNNNAPPARTGETLLRALREQRERRARAEGLSPQFPYYIAPDMTLRAESRGRLGVLETLRHFLTQTAIPVFLLLGDSGAGKSLFSAYAEQQLELHHDIIPLRFDLKRFTPLTRDALAADYGLTIDEFNTLLTHHRLIFFFDGFDEWPSAFTQNIYQALDLQHARNVRLIITCRSTHLAQLGTGYQRWFASAPTRATETLMERYLAPFSPSQRQRYLTQRYPEWEGTPMETDVQGWIARLPDADKLLSNPFLLRLFGESLPRLRVESTLTLTRFRIYEVFMQQWFEREVSRIQAQLGTETALMQHFTQFAERLAHHMVVANVVEIDMASPDAARWQPFFESSDLAIVQARIACPLKRIDTQRYRFLHKSFLEYFATCAYWHALARPRKEKLIVWNAGRLPLEPAIIDFLAECLKHNTTYQPTLFKLIAASRHNPQVSVAAANAITVLNHAGVSLSHYDFSHIHIEGADLNGAVLDGTDFEGANLKRVNLSHAFLRNANLQNAQLDDVHFGEYPHLVHQGAVNALALSRDDSLLVTTASECDLHVWAMPTGTSLRTLTGHTNLVTSVALSADGTRALSGSGDNTVKVWDVPTGTCLRTLTGHTHWVNSVALSADGTRALSGSGDTTLKVWDVPTGTCLHTLTGHTDNVRSVALSADGTRALSGSGDTTLKVWDVPTGTCLHTLTGHVDDVNSVALSADGTRAISGGYDTTLKVWDVPTGTCLHTLTGHRPAVWSVALSADGTRAISGGWDKTLKVWKVPTGTCLLHTLTGHTDNVRSVALSADGTRALSGSWDNTVKLWDISARSQRPRMEGQQMQWSADGQVALSIRGNNLYVWDVPTGKYLQTLIGHTDKVRSVALSADGTRALSVSKDNTVKMWDVPTGTCLRTLTGYTCEVTSVALSADGTRALSGNRDKTLKVWDVPTGTCLRTLTGHRGAVTHVALSADGTRAFSRNRNKTLKVWNVPTGRCLYTLTSHTYWVNGVALLNADGPRALSGSQGCTVKMGEVQTGRCVATLEGYTDVVMSLCWLPLGDILTNTRNGAFHHWQALEEPGQYRLVRSTQPVLWLKGCHIAGATGLSAQNQRLLMQRGAIETPVPSATHRARLFQPVPTLPSSSARSPSSSAHPSP